MCMCLPFAAFADSYVAGLKQKLPSDHLISSFEKELSGSIIDIQETGHS